MTTPIEPQSGKISARLNWLRAAVLGANDGIISTAGLVVGVAGASENRAAILTAGIAGVIAGALSMAGGEYVSVSSQRDSERAMLVREAKELREDPKGELDELVQLNQAQGLSLATAKQAAREQTKHDALGAHASIELNINPDELTNPWSAALASALSFTVGAVVPILAIAGPYPSVRVPLTFGAVVVALIATGSASAHAGGANKTRATIRVVLSGVLVMTATYLVGHIFKVTGI